MNFRTEIETPLYEEKIDISDSLFFIGSCFSENIGNMLVTNGFNCTINPYGATYNPLSVCKVLDFIERKKNIGEHQIVQSDGVFRSLMHHSFIYGDTPEELLKAIETRNITACESLQNSKYIFITLGTSWVFEYLKTGEVVNNCHKIPAKEFHRRPLSVDEIVTAFDELFNRSELLRSKKIFFTLSPIRHLKDGLAGNFVSKATLRVAIDRLCQHFGNVRYFPAYEIMTDDLRDYRFWGKDMVHPSPVAIEYIFEVFKKSLIDPSADSYMKHHAKRQKALAHRPIKADLSDPVF